MRTFTEVGMEIVKKTVPSLEDSSYFYRRFDNYDLIKLAFVPIKRVQ
jgi:hypothetical protein